MRRDSTWQASHLDLTWHTQPYTQLQKGNTKVVQLLLEHNAAKDTARNLGGETPLYMAAQVCMPCTRLQYTNHICNMVRVGQNQSAHLHCGVSWEQ